MDKLKLDEKVDEDKENVAKEAIRNYKTLREKNDPCVFVLPIRIKGKYDTHALADTGSNINVLPCGMYEKIRKGEAKPIEIKIKIGIINTIKGTTSTFNGICHQKFPMAAVKNKQEEKESDDKEEIIKKRDENGKPFYGMSFEKYLDYDSPMDRTPALQGTHNPF
nr:hypothetical protein [Tanacetum cinerariifolium]